jgi:glycosyltransferase involved in cell wall biosynthesis
MNDFCAQPARRPLVSVVIPSHDYGRYLPGCLVSLQRQDIGADRLEVIVADDASSDGSLDLAQRLLPGMGFAAWRAFGVPRAGRPGPVRNAGLALAAGRHLLTLDPDDALKPGYLRVCLDALEAGADVAYTDFVLARGDTLREVRLGAFRRQFLANQNILAPTAMFRRELWDRGARFRAATAYEDWDFWIQLALRGARFAHVREPLYYYRLHGANYSNAVRREDARAKAHIVLDNAAFFPSWTLDWARGVAQGRPDPMPRGVIPVLREHAVVGPLP